MRRGELDVDWPQQEEIERARAAPRHRRLLALLTDLSLFVALALALSPLLPPTPQWEAFVGLAGFVLVISYYYFVGAWLLWGKTIGGRDLRHQSHSSRCRSDGPEERIASLGRRLPLTAHGRNRIRARRAAVPSFTP